MVAGIRFTVCAASDVGRSRKNNEDAFSVSDAASGLLLSNGGTREIEATNPILLAVSDGMGGENAGEVASALALHALREAPPRPSHSSGARIVMATAPFPLPLGAVVLRIKSITSDFLSEAGLQASRNSRSRGRGADGACAAGERVRPERFRQYRGRGL